MNWMFWMILAGIVVAYLAIKRVSLASIRKAQEALRHGAIVIDVRSKEEFQDKHLPGAVNIPLDDLSSEIGRVAPDKSKTLLLHCLSGGRSGIARFSLKRMGYSSVHN